MIGAVLCLVLFVEFILYEVSSNSTGLLTPVGFEVKQFVLVVLRLSLSIMYGPMWEFREHSHNDTERISLYKYINLEGSRTRTV